MAPFTDIPVVSLCEGPITFPEPTLRAAGLDPARARITMAGLNHNCWSTEHLYDGADIMPLLEEVMAATRAMALNSRMARAELQDLRERAEITHAEIDQLRRDLDHASTQARHDPQAPCVGFLDYRVQNRRLFVSRISFGVRQAAIIEEHTGVIIFESDAYGGNARIGCRGNQSSTFLH